MKRGQACPLPTAGLLGILKQRDSWVGLLEEVVWGHSQEGCRVPAWWTGSVFCIEQRLTSPCRENEACRYLA